MIIPFRRVVIAALAVVGAAGAANPVHAADDDAKSRWGIVGTFSPSWKDLQALDKILSEEVDIAGSEFTIGVARGREQSGDWGVEYIRKQLKDGSRVDDSTRVCADVCYQFGQFYLTRGVSFSGLEVYKFIPFGTIKRRVQIGLNLAVGVGQFNGQIEVHRLSQGFLPDVLTRQTTVVPTETVTVESVRKLLKIDPFPIGKVELAVAVIVAPGLKIRTSGGLNFPGTQKFAVTVVYFLGR